MAIVWSCSLDVDSYLAADRGEVIVPRPLCPGCGAAMVFWSGYRRWIRHAGRAVRAWVARAKCRPCAKTHALLPCFVLTRRLDVVATVGTVLTCVATGASGVRPAAKAVGVPHTTARGWWRAFAGKAPVLAAGFAALAVSLGGLPPPAERTPARAALVALAAAWSAVRRSPAQLVPPLWCFASVVCGGAMLSATTGPPWWAGPDQRWLPSTH